VIISVPVWGDWHRHLFETFSYPSYRDQLTGDDFLLIHGGPFAGIPAVYLGKPDADSDYGSAAKAHRQALRLAHGETVVFIQPDCAVSEGALDAIRRAVDSGNRLVACCSLRARQDAPPPARFDSRSLIDWVLTHPHEITKKSTWGHPTSNKNLSITLFPTIWGAVARCFHLHPIAMRTTDTDFRGTIDDGLVSSFHPDEVHVVTDSDGLALVEISPDSKSLGTNDGPVSIYRLHAFYRRSHEMHRWFFEHRICLKAKDFN
jgi:hypothetical protein